MSLTLKPFPEYKPCDNTWLSRAPAHWSVEPLFVHFRERQERNLEMREKQVLSLSYGRIIKKADEDLHGLVPASFETYQIVHPGNLILRLTDLQNDQRSLRVGLAKDRGIITSAYLCLAVGEMLLPRFAYYLLHAADVQKLFYGMGAGLRQSMGFAELRRMPLVVPSIEEQRQIVFFLDAHGAYTEKLIRAKRRKIELLNEQKQVVIERAVMRGIDGCVRFEPSSVDWIGDIPKHWRVSRCGHLFREVVDSGHPDLPLLSIDRFKGIIPQSETGRRTRASEDRSAYKRVKPGEIAYNLMNAFMGSISASIHEGIISPAYAVARSKTELDIWYFHNLLRTRIVTGQFERLSYGIMYERNRLYFDRFKTLSVPFPPVEEQHRIVAHIETHTAEIDGAIAGAIREIDLLREYRTGLVADVVTGKLDVCGVELPEANDLEEAGTPDDIEGEEELVAAAEGDDAAD